MKTLIIIETAEELVKFANPNRIEGDATPFLGSGAKLVFENDFAHITLAGAKGFELAANISLTGILIALAIECNLQIHVT